uniref:Putative secreted protein n=1 Tax=Ixodes ricinus TaxID=34613 RepID=A0A6B0UH99_IXORI
MGRNIRIVIIWSFSRKMSLLVILRTAVRVSCTMPMTGLFDCGVMICRGTMASCSTSARVSSDCGTCRFISSPSKSALYGVVTLRFILKVDQGSTLILCPIMDILCSVG